MNLISAIRTWGEMIRFSHSVFALPFALVATFLAGRHRDTGLPTLGQFLLIIACMIFARSFAMTFNRIADARLDARNPRTEDRPIPAGKITGRQAWFFLGVTAAGFALGCAGFWWGYGNAWPLILAIPTLLFLAGYSYTKRFTMLAHFALGAAIAFSPAAAWIAIHPASIGLSTLLLTAAVLLWITGFDIIYACQDVDVDRREKLHSLPARIGIGLALLISRICHVFTVGALVGLGFSAGFGWIYWAAVALTAVLLAAEQSVVSPRDLSRVNLAFFTLNGCVSVALGAAAIADLLIL
ncbi:MAG: UbiA-like polyprenyltransferase [Planctomycetota bacterium]|nr:putative 4-hydroxybenzoate polyprenyltransferase [Planctomycetota bacterium]